MITTLLYNTLHININSYPYLKELKLAHSATNDENFHISVKIGTDF